MSDLKVNAQALGNLMALAGELGGSVTVEADGVHLVRDSSDRVKLGATLPVAERKLRELCGEPARGKHN